MNSNILMIFFWSLHKLITYNAQTGGKAFCRIPRSISGRNVQNLKSQKFHTGFLRRQIVWLSVLLNIYKYYMIRMYVYCTNHPINCFNYYIIILKELFLFPTQVFFGPRAPKIEFYKKKKNQQCFNETLMLILTLLKNIAKKYNIQKLTVSISNLILVPTVVNKNATRRRR